LFIIVYDVVALRKARIFYHIYGEIVLELFLIVFWVTSFSGMGSYVSETSELINLVSDDPSLASRISTTHKCSIAIAILGALVLYVYFSCRRKHPQHPPPPFFTSPSISKQEEENRYSHTPLNSALSLANFMFLIAYVVKEVNKIKEGRVEDGATADVSRPPAMREQIPPTFIGSENQA
jgi:hypothetical protein